MNDVILWLEAHDQLAGWAQFAGAMVALVLTYITAFAPTWRRRKQLVNAGFRLLANGYETLESYDRTSANFAPFPLSVRAASMTMQGVVEEIARFPIYELEDQRGNSLARRLVAMSGTLNGTRMVLDNFALRLDTDDAGDAEWEEIRTFVGDRLRFTQDLLTGKKLERPEWPPMPQSR